VFNINQLSRWFAIFSYKDPFFLFPKFGKELGCLSF